MVLYAESSAVLSWLLGEPGGADIARALSAADQVVSSDLTLVECDRVIHRATALGELSASVAVDLHRRLARTVRHWTVLRLSAAIVERARRPFPIEPIRSLDALHVASALEAQRAVPDLAILTLDGRTREVSEALGLDVRPA